MCYEAIAANTTGTRAPTDLLWRLEGDLKMAASKLLPVVGGRGMGSGLEGEGDSAGGHPASVRHCRVRGGGGLYAECIFVWIQFVSECLLLVGLQQDFGSHVLLVGLL